MTIREVGLRVGLCACVLIAAGCAPKEARRGARVPVAVAVVETRTVPDEIDATGTVEPVASADVTAQVGGLVTRIAFREGDDVRAGQVLVALDARPFQASFAQAAAILERDRAQARTARRELERGETLARQQLLSPGELDDKRSAAEALAATVLADSANLEKARLDLAYATVRAPISGRTGKLNVHEGDVVKANETSSPLVTIHQLHPIRVRFTVPQAELPSLRAGKRGDVRVLVQTGLADSAWSEGRLVFVDNQVDAASGTVLLKGEFPNADGALWPGAFARVRLRLAEQAGALVVPAAAVTNSQQGTVVYVVKPDTTVEVRPVGVLRTWRGITVVANGLSAGETVVIDGQVRLSPGAKASIRGASADSARAGGAPAAKAAR